MNTQEQRELIAELKLFFQREWGIVPRSDKLKKLIAIARQEKP